MQNLKQNSKFAFWLAISIGTTLYAFARSWNLTASCLWFDEIFGVHAASHDWSGMFRFIAQDLIHPPLFYVLLKIWILIGGESLWWLRLFPVFWSVVAIAPFLLLCRELKLKNIEIFAAFILLATNGALIRYAQEVRMYSVLFCLALFSLWLFVKFLNQSTLVTLAQLFVVNLLLVYTHYFGWLFVAIELLAVIWFKPQKARQFLASSAILSVCFAPWVYAVWQAAPTTNALAQNIGWQAKPNLLRLVPFFLTLSEPFYYQQSSVDAANFYLIAIPVIIICLIAIFANFTRGKLQLLFFFAFAPVVLAFIASWIAPYSIWGTRHLIIVFPAFVLLAVVSLNNLRNNRLRIATFAFLICLISIAGFRYFLNQPPTFIWCGWENLVQEARDAEKKYDSLKIYAFEDLVAYHLWFATESDQRVSVVLINGYADMPEDAAYFLPRGFDDVAVADKTQIIGDEFWLAFRDAKWNADKQVLLDLQNQNYKIGAPLEFRAQGVTAFLVKVEK